MRKPRMFRGQLRPVLGLEIQLREIVDLPFQPFAFGHVRRGIALKRAPPLGLVAPVAVCLGHLVRLRFQPAVGIDQFALRGGSRQRLMLMLAVDVHQQLAELAQLCSCHRSTVDERA
jgi:hypothetical protein